MEKLYDEEEFQERVRAWAESALQTDSVQVDLVTPRLAYAVLACNVQWRHAANAKVPAAASDMTLLSKLLQDKLGPLARLTPNQNKQHSIHVCLLPMPDSAWPQINAIVNRTARIFHAQKNRSLRFYTIIFVLATVNLFGGLLKLHNHQYGYEEPWETPLEFFKYHILYWVGLAPPHTHDKQ